MPQYFGCHVSSSGGLENAIKNGATLEVNTIQLHPSPPQRWNSKPYEPNFEANFNTERKNSQIEKIFFHAIYLINMATPDAQHFYQSKQSLSHYLDLSARINGDGVIFHVGSLKDEPDEIKGFMRAADGINSIMEKVSEKARLILEVAAGSGSVIGDRVEELAAIYERVDNKNQVGFALDSQHMWASGYDLANNLESIIKNVDEVLGLQKIWAIHLNDSKTELGSKKDRHENFGDGLIGKDALTKFFMHPKLAKIPFILETPSMKSLDTARIEVDKLRDCLASRLSLTSTAG